MYGFIILYIGVFQIMLGLHNPFFNFLYQHLTGFSVFRNISKFAGLLSLLTSLLLLFFLLRLHSKLARGIFGLFLVLALAYNVPYWFMPTGFFKGKALKEIPADYREAAFFLNNTTQPNNSAALVLPATYITDTYKWNNENVALKGSLFDVLVNMRTFRLSPKLIGDYAFQTEMGEIFVLDDTQVRGLRVDYTALDRLALRYNLNYAILTKDLVGGTDYGSVEEIYTWLQLTGFNKIADFRSVEIYRRAQGAN